MTARKFVKAARLDDVPPEARMRLQMGDVDLLLCHTQDRIFAVRNQCSHAHESLECGRMKAGWIACPVHGARFDLETGAALNPPASTPIDTFEVRIEGEAILVAL